MAAQSICSIPNCGKDAYARGWCRMHYSRYYRHGDPNVTKTAPEGAGLEFLLEHVGYSGSDCIEWPFSRTGLGYGQTYYEGKVCQTHRLMCRLKYGEPAVGMQAAHSCGNYACINPNHLWWATAGENINEKKRHGREALGSSRHSAKITEAQARYALEMDGKKPAAQVARELGVDPMTVRAIQTRKTWRHL